MEDFETLLKQWKEILYNPATPENLSKIYGFRKTHVNPLFRNSKYYEGLTLVEEMLKIANTRRLKNIVLKCVLIALFPVLTGSKTQSAKIEALKI